MGLAYVAATLLLSGAGHVARFAVFRDLLVGHAVIPPRHATPVALTLIDVDRARPGP
jgi:hypothetical protein